jgi:hypothetical protein
VDGGGEGEEGEVTPMKSSTEVEVEVEGEEAIWTRAIAISCLTHICPP